MLDYIFTGRKRIAASVGFDRYTATIRKLIASLDAGALTAYPHHLVIFGLGPPTHKVHRYPPIHLGSYFLDALRASPSLGLAME